jgi:hypothetical protein
MTEFRDRSMIVTRNSHKIDIEHFLASKGLKGVPVCVVKKGESKGSIVCREEFLSDDDDKENVTLFVDDDVNELVADDLKSSTKIWRVLFDRS